MSANSVQMLPVGAIVAGVNDRTVFDAERLAELASSIEQNGLAQPITVRPVEGGTRYEIIAGERRFRAMTEILKKQTVPCLVRNMDDEMASSIMLAENAARQDLNPMDEARAYEARMTRFDWSEEDIARIAGVSKERVKKRVALLTLIPDAQQLVSTGNLGLGHAESLSRLDSNRQISALRILQSSKQALTVGAFRSICQQLFDEQCQEGLFTLEGYWIKQMEQEIPIQKRGKRALTGAPTRTDLPVIVAKGTDSTSAVIDRYIKTLLEAGKGDEAGAIGTLYTRLVQGNWLSVPDNAELLKETTGQELSFAL
jgi:ParB family chromosome partitioning protein